MRTVVVSQCFHMFDGMCVIDDPVFQFAWIAGDRMLDDERVTALPDFWQMFDEWPNVLGQEDEAIHIARREVDGIKLPTVGIDRLKITRLQTVHEPFAIEGWNIGSVTS